MPTWARTYCGACARMISGRVTSAWAQFRQSGRLGAPDAGTKAVAPGEDGGPGRRAPRRRPGVVERHTLPRELAEIGQPWCRRRALDPGRTRVERRHVEPEIIGDHEEDVAGGRGGGRGQRARHGECSHHGPEPDPGTRRGTSIASTATLGAIRSRAVQGRQSRRPGGDMAGNHREPGGLREFGLRLASVRHWTTSCAGKEIRSWTRHGWAGRTRTIRRTGAREHYSDLISRIICPARRSGFGRIPSVRGRRNATIGRDEMWERYADGRDPP